MVLDLGPTFCIGFRRSRSEKWKCRSKKSSLSQEKDSEAEKMSNLIWKKRMWREKIYKLDNLDCNIVYEEKHYQAEMMLSLDTKSISKYQLKIKMKILHYFHNFLNSGLFFSLSKNHQIPNSLFKMNHKVMFLLVTSSLRFGLPNFKLIVQAINWLLSEISQVFH